MRKCSGVLFKISLIFKKFCNIMKYIINITFIGDKKGDKKSVEKGVTFSLSLPLSKCTFDKTLFIRI